MGVAQNSTTNAEHDVAHVAKHHVEHRGPERQPLSQRHQTHEHRDQEQQRKGNVKCVGIERDQRQHTQGGEGQVQHVGEHGAEGDDPRGYSSALDHLGVLQEAAGPIGPGVGQEVPGNQSQDQEHGIGIDTGREHDAEEHAHHDHEDRGIGQRPQKPERLCPVGRTKPAEGERFEGVGVRLEIGHEAAEGTPGRRLGSELAHERGVGRAVPIEPHRPHPYAPAVH